MRNFNDWLESFMPSIADYKYYVDFKKVFNNVDDIKIPLNILNSLIGSKSIEEDFKSIISVYPETLRSATLLGRRFLGIDQSEQFLQLSKARREELNDIGKRSDYLTRLQKQAKLFKDNEVKVINDNRIHYGAELPF